MPQVATNADDYAANRQNVFFPGIVPSLDGQCVSLVKWFLQEMTDVPNPQAARGDARYVGQTLVAQGHATEVNWAERRRGDIVTYEYGLYGHIGVVLSGNRTFEENVNWPGVAAKVVDGATVYASRIGSLAEAWRHDMHIYRIKTYKESDMPTIVDAAILEDLTVGLLGRGLYDAQGNMDANLKNWLGAPVDEALRGFIHYPEHQALIKRSQSATASDQDIGRVYLMGLGRAPAEQETADNRGTMTTDLIKGVIESPERMAYATKVDNALNAGNPPGYKPYDGPPIFLKEDK